MIRVMVPSGIFESDRPAPTFLDLDALFESPLPSLLSSFFLESFNSF